MYKVNTDSRKRAESQKRRFKEQEEYIYIKIEKIIIRRRNYINK